MPTVDSLSAGSQAHRGLRSYGDVLRVPEVAGLVVAATLARLPQGLMGLGLILFVSDRTGSYAQAGAVVAAFAVGSACVGPSLARIVDGRGASRVLPTASAAHAAAVVVLVVVAELHAPTAALLAAGANVGAAMPSISAVLRTQWPILLVDRPELLPSAFALDSVGLELIFVAGPVLVAVLAAAVGPLAPLCVSVVCTLVGTTAFVARMPPSTSSRRLGQRTLLGVLRAPGLVTVVLGMVPFGFVLGATEVALPALAAQSHQKPLAGPLLAAWGLGSAAGGLAYGARRWSSSLTARFVVTSGLVAASVAPLTLARSVPAALPLAVLAGFALAPTMTTGHQLVARLSSAAQRTEAHTWATTAVVVGAAAGSAATGLLVEAVGAAAAFLVATLVGLAGTGLLIVRRVSLGRTPVDSRPSVAE